MPFWMLSAACGILMVGLAALLWMRRPPAVLWPIAFVCQLLALLWVGGDLWASHAQSLPEKHLALSVLFTGSIGLPVMWWELIRRYLAWHKIGGRRLSGWAPRWVPMGCAAVFWTFAVTNPWHGQFFEPVVGGQNVYPWGVYVVSYAWWTLTIATAVVCGWAAWRHPSPAVQQKLALLSVATLMPLAANLFHVFASGPREDTVAIGLGLASATVLYGIYKQRLFNLVPVGLHEILRSDRDGTLFLDRGGRLLLWNPAAEKLLDGVSLKPEMPLFEILAGRLEEVAEERRLESSADLVKILTRENGGRPVFRYLGGGGERWLRMSLAPVPSRRRRLSAVFLRVEDATREERFTQDRMGRDRARHRDDESLALMAGGVAHDFNNLLTVIEGRARVAVDDAGRGLPVRRHLMGILKATELARDLTAELVNYAGRAVAEPQPIELSELVTDMQPLLADLVPPQIELRTELAGELPPVRGDATQLRQVVMNLVKNGAEAIGDQLGVVVLRASLTHVDPGALDRDDPCSRLSPGEHVLLEVADSGCGMAEEARRRAFDAFFSTKTSGRGLGLAVVSGIVETHQGAVGLESRPEWGSTFRVWLPVSRIQ